MASEPPSNGVPAEAEVTSPANVANTGSQPSVVLPGTQFSHPLDRFWYLYLIDAEKIDKKLTDSWKGDTDGILIFTGLFAATVASFIIAIFPALSPDLSADTVALLKQIAQNQISGSSESRLNLTLPSDTFTAPASALRINILWILSLFLSLCCALAATLVQQWTRQYLSDSQPRGPPRKRGPVHAYLRAGMEQYGFARCVDVIVTLLHVSVFLFMGGLLEFSFDLHAAAAYGLLALEVTGIGVYVVLTVLGTLFPDCPYRTPLTPAIWTLYTWSRASCLYLLQPLKRTKSWRLWETCSRASTLAGLHNKGSCQRPAHVFTQMARGLDEDHELHQYLLTFPSFFASLLKMSYPIVSMIEAGEWYSPVDQIVAWYQQPRIPGSPPLSPKLLEKVIVLTNSLLKGQPWRVNDKLFDSSKVDIRVFDWNWQLANAARPPSTEHLSVSDHQPLPLETLPFSHRLAFYKVMNRNRLRSFRALLHHENDAVSFLSCCHILSMSLLCPDEGSISYLGFLPSRPHSIITVYSSGTRFRDNLLQSLMANSLQMADLYRLLYLIRIISHFSMRSTTLLETYEHIWIPILGGLRKLALCKLSKISVSEDARSQIEKFIARFRPARPPDDDQGFKFSFRTDLFRAYPLLDECLQAIEMKLHAEAGSQAKKSTLKFRPIEPAPEEPRITAALHRAVLRDTPRGWDYV